MGPRLLTFATVTALALFVVGGTAFAQAVRDDREVLVSKDEDATDVVITDDDDDDGDDTAGDDSGGFTSGVDSNDGTNSRVTSVTRGDDRSRGDLTRDMTKDGPARPPATRAVTRRTTGRVTTPDEPDGTRPGGDQPPGHRREDPMSAMTRTERPRQAWSFDEGDAIAEGLTALRLLGGGTRYEAYLAFDARLHHAVVVKMLRPDRREDGAALNGLRGEAEILRSVNHPAVARLLSEDLDGERPHIVLELVEGPRLSTLIRRFGPLELEQAAPLAVEVASALHYLHGSGLVHLDVKPKNLIMGAPPRLIDLSIARSIEAARVITQPIGTDAFMAPEQCRPVPNRIGPPADVWGLGITMHEALTDRPVFSEGAEEDDAPLEARFPQLVDRAAPMPPSVPAELRAPVEAALALDPADRPTAREMAEAVEPLLRRPRRLALNRLKPR